MTRFIQSVVFAIADLLEREAGYHLVSLALILIGVTAIDAQQRPQVGHDLIVFGTGVLARSMSGKLAKGPPA